MSKDPAFLFYPNDYLGGTMGFSFKQHGAYLMLLIFQFNNGPFKKETAIGMVGEELFNSICHKFEEKDGCICNARLMQEITRRKEYSQNRRENAKNGWKKRKNNSISNESAKHMQSTCNDSALHMGNETRTRTRARNKDETENIYAAYPRKKGKLAALKSIEKAFKIIEPDVLLEKVKKYAESVKDKDPEFIPYPSTWFNQGRWEDEIEKPVNNRPKEKLPVYTKKEMVI